METRPEQGLRATWSRADALDLKGLWSPEEQTAAQEDRSAATTIPGLQPPRGHGRHHVLQETEVAYPSGRGLPRTCSHVPKPGAVLLPIVHMKKLKLGERVETLGDSQAPAGECRSRGTLLGDQGQLV